MKKLFKAFILVSIFSCVSLAGGSFNLTGKFKSLEEKTVVIESGSKAYTILRSALGPAQELMIKKTPKNELISLTVNFDGVESVKNLPTSKK